MTGRWWLTRAALAAAVALPLALAGCDDADPADGHGVSGGPVPEPLAWPVYRGGPAMTGTAAGALPDAFKLRWSFATGDAIVGTPVVSAAGVAYIGSLDGKLYAIDTVTGKRAWSVDTADGVNRSAIEAPPMLHDGVVYVGTSLGRLHALDAATGEPRWLFAAADKMLGSANVASVADASGGRRTLILVGSYDNTLYALDAADGTVAWSVETGNYINGAPAVASGKVVFGGCDGEVHFADAATGERGPGITIGEPVAATVASFGDSIIVGHYGKAVERYRIADRSLVWRFKRGQPFFATAATDGRIVVTGCRDDSVYALDYETGELKWEYETRGRVDASPLIVGDKVAVAGEDGRLYMLALADGKALWRYEIGEAIVGSPVWARGLLMIGSEDGNLYAFESGVAGADSDE